MSEATWQALQHDDLVEAKIISGEVEGHRVDVYVPSDVNASSPVLVMHDGKNLFWPEHSTMGETWGVIEAVQTLRTRPIVIGVWIADNPAVPSIRYFELAPQQVLEAEPSLFGDMPVGEEVRDHALLGDAYHRMIAEQIIPEIISLFGLDLEPENTALCGSSMGGLTSLYGAGLYPNVYGTALSLSTHLAYWSPDIIEAVLSGLSTESRTRIWIDRGTEELDALYEGLHERAADYLESKGWITGSQFQAKVYQGTNHSEPVWRDRLPEILHWWLQDASD